MMVLPALSLLNLPEARAESEPDEIVAADLLTVREPKSEAESRLRVIRRSTPHAYATAYIRERCCLTPGAGGLDLQSGEAEHSLQ